MSKEFTANGTEGAGAYIIEQHIHGRDFRFIAFIETAGPAAIRRVGTEETKGEKPDAG